MYSRIGYFVQIFMSSRRDHMLPILLNYSSDHDKRGFGMWIQIRSLTRIIHIFLIDQLSPPLLGSGEQPIFGYSTNMLLEDSSP